MVTDRIGIKEASDLLDRSSGEVYEFVREGRLNADASQPETPFSRKEVLALKEQLEGGAEQSSSASDD